MVTFNGGEPVPPGWQMTCCGCIPCGPKFLGIPDGAERLSPSEEQDILARWQGHFKLQQIAGPSAQIAFTDVYIDGNIMAFSGGMHNSTQYVDGSTIKTAVANSPQQQRILLWRGSDGTLYLDNTGSMLESETPLEIKIKNSLGYRLAFIRQTPMTSAGMGIAAPVAVAQVANPAMTAMPGTVAFATPGQVVAEATAIPVPEEIERAPNVAEDLKKLADLKAAGALTEEEFDAAKAKLLS